MHKDEIPLLPTPTAMIPGKQSWKGKRPNNAYTKGLEQVILELLEEENHAR